MKEEYLENTLSGKTDYKKKKVVLCHLCEMFSKLVEMEDRLMVTRDGERKTFMLVGTRIL